MAQGRYSPEMAKANLLNTSTSNVVELVGNGRVFTVPQYQRDYSWTEEQWEDLWNDITELAGRPDDSHYLGALVVAAKSDRNFEIIDGQQRLATLSIFALAIIDRLGLLALQDTDAVNNKERAIGLRYRFIGEKDPASLVEASKIYLNHTNNDFYQDYLVQLRQPINPRGLVKSDKLLWDCFKYFKGQIADCLDWKDDGERLARLLSETVGRQLMFIRITVDDELNAYTVFETLNARGLELTSTDLLKNYLFSRIAIEGDRTVLQRRWQSLIDRVGSQNFPEFLRYHLLCTIPKVRTQRLFKIVREMVKSPAEVFSLLDNLDARGELYAALKDYNHGFWIDLPDAKSYIRDLNQFRVRQMTPLLFAAWERFDPAEFVRTLKLITTISFRYTVISSLNTNSLEPIYHEAAKGVLNGTILRTGQVFNILRPIYVRDDAFKTDFANLNLAGTGLNRKLAKYILAKLETQVSGRQVDPETDAGTIEHILPDNPNQDWVDNFPAASWEANIDRLGNLTLLEAAKNRELGSSNYQAKTAMYPTSSYGITRQIIQIAPVEWTPALLDLRQRNLADLASIIWRSDFT